MSSAADNYNARRAKKAKSHKEAERRRRERISGHMATFRALVAPEGQKMDKASLLAEVVNRLEQLRQGADEVYALKDGWVGYWPIPDESDELTVEYYKEDNNQGSMGRMIRISFSCEDRPDLLSDLIKAIKKSVQGKVVKAEMSTVGGRWKSELLVQLLPGLDKVKEVTKPITARRTRAAGRSVVTSTVDEVTTLRRAMKPVINKPPTIAPCHKWLYA